MMMNAMMMMLVQTMMPVQSIKFSAMCKMTSLQSKCSLRETKTIFAATTHDDDDADDDIDDDDDDADDDDDDDADVEDDDDDQVVIKVLSTWDKNYFCCDNSARRLQR